MSIFKKYFNPIALITALVMNAFISGCSGGGSGVATPIGTTSAAITTYSIGGASGIINETAKTIAVTVPYGTNKTALVATFTTTGTSVKVGTTVQTSAVTANDFTTPVAYIVTAGDGTTATYTVTVTRASIAAKAITAYSINGIAGTINETAKTIAVYLPSGTSKTALIATFTTTGTSVKVGTAVQTSAVTANNFTTPVAYIVTAGDASTATYTVTVNVASNSDKAITAYSILGVAGTINETAKTISVTVPFGTLKTNLVATFATTGANVKVGTTVQTSAVTANDFTIPVAYIVTAVDGTTVPYDVSVIVAPANPTAPVLGEAGRFVILARALISTTGTTAISNGDIGITPAARTFITGFTPSGPAGDFTELTNGTSFAPEDSNPLPFPYPLHYSTPVVGAPWTTTAAMLTQSSTDWGIAATFLAADPNPGAATQVCPAELGAQVLTRGVYKTASNVTITAGALHLDAQGDPTAVFIFNLGGTLTTGVLGSIILDNGAQAKNIYWRTAGVTTIASDTIFYGNVFSTTDIHLLSGADVTGSLFSETQVTLIGNNVTKAP